ncbi:MAG: hypothetical protein BWX71_01110 [Deltaproteobacteria bacterium ADurb.Bin072]|nr:MAG: hypothetical protein BWX71_01110 [Deltaproteobacteria bacterium ADurb.Bin072]
MGLCISRFQVVAVVGGHYGGTAPACQVHDERVDHVLVGQAVMLDLQVEGTPEGLPVEVQGLGRLRLVPPQEPEGYLSLEAGGQSDEPLAVLGKCPSVYPRFVVESPGVGQRGQLHEVRIALVVARQQDEMVVSGHAGDGLPALHVRGGDVDLAPDDGLDTCLDGLVVELNGPIHDTVVRYGHRLLGEFHRGPDEVIDADGPVEEAVLGMTVEMNESHLDPNTPICSSAPLSR